ncbi:histidinol-phosphatase [Halosquirtibacter xylanolyticus]|uniref:histidinol-phosphatase n=1 Tax=Halosquirtibacter xylanolyticus TaxID=3374599 RepID=UPI00374A6D39|nr:histidinol-phosphatase [Prolixibacteraceae bacterium]
MIFDYHIHTKYSDGVATHQEIIDKAVALGVDEIGFSDHYGYYPNNWTTSRELLSKMVEEVLLQKSKQDKIKVLLGLEVDFYPDRIEETKEVLSMYPFDYIMGSVHFINGDNFDSDPHHPIYSKYDINHLYELYYENFVAAVRSGMFDTMSHPDLIKKYNYYPTKDFSTLYREVAKVLVEEGVMVEYNTSGYSRPCNDFFPSDEVTSIFLEEGVQFTIGSDSHKLDHLLRNYDLAKERLMGLGLTELHRYNSSPILLKNFIV